MGFAEIAMQEILRKSEVNSRDAVNILHISDLHYGIGNARKNIYNIDAGRQQDAVNGLIKTLKDDIKVPVNWKPNIIVISGDIAWTGQHDEYKMFENNFLKPILQALGDLPKERVIVCPGNHDIIRSAADGYERPHKDQNIQIRAISRESISSKRNVHFQGYVDFFCDGNSQKLCQSVTLPEWPWLRFLVMNSAWDCRDNDDEGRLRVGLELLEEILHINYVEDDTIIAIFHHPNSEIRYYDLTQRRQVIRHWLHTSERFPAQEGDICFSEKLESKANFILNGHIHKETKPLHSETGKSIKLYCGTSYSNDTVNFHCRIIQIAKNGEPFYMDLRSTLSNGDLPWEAVAPKDFKPLYAFRESKKRTNSYIQNIQVELESFEKALCEFKENVKTNSRANIIEAILEMMRSICPDAVIENSFLEEMGVEKIIDQTLEDVKILRLNIRM